MKVFGEGFYRRPYSISFDERDVDPFLQEASKLETVNGLVLDNAQFTADSPEHIAKMQKLNYVGLDNVTISPDHFQQFALLPHVAHFRIDCVDLTDAHLEAMGNCRSLKSVTLFDTRLSDEGLRSLNQIPSLKELNITLPRAITERGFDSLAGLPSLEKLFLTHVPIDDQCLVAFSQIKALQTLHIVGSPEDITISEQGLDHLASLPNLEVLHLDFIPLVDEELASIGRLRQLKDFQCLGTHVTDKGLEHLLQLTHLESLRIQEAQLSMETLRSLARSDSVRTVDLGNGLKCSFPERNSGNYGMPYADNRADYDQNRRGKATRSVFCLVGEILPPLPNTPSAEDPSTTPTELPNNFADTISDPFLPPSE
ncbi:leucine-rich repeat domain-containing protein [Bremerella sp.]|uniref:leucine-rich repeat domain-containing protein n=1 Tax=Bremerella sp. TaxID=2795602 RepID=UPI0039187541